MKCALIVTSGKERSQRSSELPEKLTTRAQVVDFLKSQDLRLETGDFDFAVSFDGIEGQHQLKTDADVRLFLAQARQLCDKINFHVSLSSAGADVSADMESCLSPSYMVDLDLVTLHIYAPLQPSPPASPSRSPQYQEKTFVVPKRFVLDNLTRTVKDTVEAGVLTASSRVVVCVLTSPDDGDGVALLDDAAALRVLRAQAKRREPVRLTYSVHTAPSPTSRRTSLSSHVPPPPTSQDDEKAKESPVPLSAEEPLTAPRKSKANMTTLPPLRASDVQVPANTPSTSSPPAAAAVAAACSAQTPPSARSAVQLPSITSLSSHTPYRAFLREPVSPAGTAEVKVEVRVDDDQPLRTFTFSYIKTEIQLCRRFHAECAALCGVKSVVVLTLSSDATVAVDSDGVLRELLALSREAQQPLRVRLHVPPHQPSPKPRRSQDASAAASLSSSVSPSHAVTSTMAPSPPAEPRSHASSHHSRGSRSNGPSSGEAASREHKRETPTKASTAFLDADTPVLENSNLCVAAAPAVPPPHLSAASVEETKQDSALLADTDSEAPIAVTSTIPGTSPSQQPELQQQSPLLQPSPIARPHLCFNRNLSAKSGSTYYYLQVATAWSAELRMTQCKVQQDHLVEDVRAGVLAAYADVLDATCTVEKEKALVMELAYVKDGVERSLVLSCTLQTADWEVLTEMCVETTELRVVTSSPPSTGKPFVRRSSSGSNEDVLSYMSTALVQHFARDGAPVSSKNVHTLLRSVLGTAAAAATKPFHAFLSKVATTSLELDSAQPSAPRDVKRWLQGLVAELSLSPAQVTTLLHGVAAALLCDRFRDSQRASDDYFDLVSTAIRHSVKVLPTSGDTLRALWTRTASAYTAPTRGSESPAELPLTSEQWSTCYTTAPSAVLDFIAAAHMEGLLRTPHPLDTALPMEVVREACHTAQLHFCEQLTTAEMETFFKEDVTAQSDALQRCRGMVLSAVGALLAPATPAAAYADWLTDHFRGRVGAALYAKMGDFDGHTALPLPSLLHLCWTLYHPQLPSLCDSASPHKTLLSSVVGWARVAAAHACCRRHVDFLPCPLYGVHASSPAPLRRCAAVLSTPCPPSLPTSSPEVTKTTETAVESAPAEATQAEVSAPPPLSPSPPPAEASPAHRKTPKKRVQYVYKYNLNALRRPRSSAT